MFTVCESLDKRDTDGRYLCKPLSGVLTCHPPTLVDSSKTSLGKQSLPNSCSPSALPASCQSSSKVWLKEGRDNRVVTTLNPFSPENHRRLKTKEAGTYFCPCGNHLSHIPNFSGFSSLLQTSGNWEEVLLQGPELEKPTAFLQSGGPGPWIVG